MFDIVSIGNATMDAFVQINPRRHFHAKRGEVFFVEGSKIEVEALRFFSGGAATNTAVAFARQGLRTGILCEVGSDEFGNDILAELKREKVDASLVLQTKKYKTAFSVVLTGHGLNRVIFAFGGATRHLDESMRKINWKKLSYARAVYLGSLHSSLQMVKKIASFCAKHGILLAWNPGQSELKQGFAKLKAVLQHVSVLFLNGEEARQCAGQKYYRDNMRALARFVPLVVVSLGPQGAAAFDGHRFFFERAHRAQKKDSTGAGDAFNAGFLAAVLQNKPMDTCLANGVANATSVIKYLGAKNRLLHKKKRGKK